MQRQERLVVLVGLDHEEIVAGDPRVAAPGAHPSARDAGGREPGRGKRLGGHHGRGRLAVRARRPPPSAPPDQRRPAPPSAAPPAARARAPGRAPDGRPAPPRSPPPRGRPRGARDRVPARSARPSRRRRPRPPDRCRSRSRRRPRAGRRSSASALMPAPPTPTKWTGRLSVGVNRSHGGCANVSNCCRVLKVGSGRRASIILTLCLGGVGPAAGERPRGHGVSTLRMPSRSPRPRRGWPGSSPLGSSAPRRPPRARARCASDGRRRRSEAAPARWEAPGAQLRHRDHARPRTPRRPPHSHRPWDPENR